MALFNKTSFNVHNASDVMHQNPPLYDDVADFFDVSVYIDINNIIEVVYKINLFFVFTLGVTCLLLLITVFNKDVREDSATWNFYPLMAIEVYIALVLHPAYWTLKNSIVEDREICYFLHYSIDYCFMAAGYLLVVINIDVYFTIILPVKFWQRRRFFRFVVMLLSMWLLVMLLVGHVVINNNKSQPGHYCYYLDKDVIIARDAMQLLVPAGCCFLLTIVTILTHALKRFRIGSTSGNILEVRSIHTENELQWIACIMIMNCLFIMRAILESIILMKVELLYGKVITRDRFVSIVLIHIFRGQSLYYLPLGLFCLTHIRQAFKMNILKVLKRATCMKLDIASDTEDLAVHYTDQTME